MMRNSDRLPRKGGSGCTEHVRQPDGAVATVNRNRKEAHRTPGTVENKAEKAKKTRRTKDTLRGSQKGGGGRSLATSTFLTNGARHPRKTPEKCGKADLLSRDKQRHGIIAHWRSNLASPRREKSPSPHSRVATVPPSARVSDPPCASSFPRHRGALAGAASCPPPARRSERDASPVILPLFTCCRRLAFRPPFPHTAPGDP